VEALVKAEDHIDVFAQRMADIADPLGLVPDHKNIMGQTKKAG
jgi:hypothetical protein